MSAALDALRVRAVEAVKARGLASRRPTWAPFLVLGDDLAGVLRELGWLAPDEPPIARLWAEFSKPKESFIGCFGFELRTGRTRTGHRIFETHASGGPFAFTWSFGPKWLKAKRGKWSEDRWFSLLCRATELGAAAAMEFAGDADAQIRIGGIMAKSCACCGRALTDAISLELGIGPECRGRIARAS